VSKEFQSLKQIRPSKNYRPEANQAFQKLLRFHNMSCYCFGMSRHAINGAWHLHCWLALYSHVSTTLVGFIRYSWYYVIHSRSTVTPNKAGTTNMYYVNNRGDWTRSHTQRHAAGQKKLTK